MAGQPGLRIEESHGVTIVGFGDVPMLDTVTTQHVAPALYALVENPANRRIVLDVADVRFLSSQTLGVLLTFRRRADKADIKVAIAGLRPELARVFEITNLDKLFTFCQSAQDALAQFKRT
jgi:anti-anti-sigma factor